MMTTLANAAASMHGTLFGNDRLFDGVSTDTRTLKNGELFIALDGPNFTGSDYVPQASEKGAAGAVVGTKIAADLAQIAVRDTRAALGELGAAWRRDQSAVVVGITGSNGKTTLKELTAACLAQTGPTLATEGNLNNDIGMPLMLTRIDAEHRYAVLEMGANHAGEIAYLTSLAEPDVVAITNAAAAHLEGFNSIKGVATAKAEILCGKMRPGVAVLNADDDYFEYWKSMAADVETLSFGIDTDADVSATDIKADGAGSNFVLHLGKDRVDVRLSLPGRHNVRNACAAAAIAMSLGVAPEQIQTALELVKPVSGRLEPLSGLNGSTLYDDSYNANPLSVAVAAEFLASLDGESWLVLGDMGELGDDSARLHREVGIAVKRAGVTRLFATGELSRNTTEAFGSNASWFESIDALIDALRVSVTTGVNVLVKGSRFMRMERVVSALGATTGMSGEA
ncbi:MAG: UDP-N-acetylmuramoyl-tripeptide--D-alanyl-D-alanine ligase [Gammaproteobacteria bacterium]|nr:UDP-N-acetylmuramoyl-tripeptide--D-alanyl-D-alanine ligase [Gammaproteobacteria bacterium]